MLVNYREMSLCHHHSPLWGWTFLLCLRTASKLEIWFFSVSYTITTWIKMPSISGFGLKISVLLLWKKRYQSACRQHKAFCLRESDTHKQRMLSGCCWYSLNTSVWFETASIAIRSVVNSNPRWRRHSFALNLTGNQMITFHRQEYCKYFCVSSPECVCLRLTLVSSKTSCNDWEQVEVSWGHRKGLLWI